MADVQVPGRSPRPQPGVQHVAGVVAVQVHPQGTFAGHLPHPTLHQQGHIDAPLVGGVEMDHLVLPTIQG